MKECSIVGLAAQGNIVEQSGQVLEQLICRKSAQIVVEALKQEATEYMCSVAGCHTTNP